MSGFWEGLLSSSISLAIIGFVCKVFLKHFDKRQIESFKSKLKYESDMRIIEDERNYGLKITRDLELGRWGLTLLSSAKGILGRLFYIKKHNNLQSDSYYTDSTRYYLCQYLCWAQLFRKNRDASVFSPSSEEMLITELIKNISMVLRENDFGFPCIRSLEQKYIGESLSVEGGCISYKEFIDSKVLEDYTVLNDFIDAILQNQNKDYIDNLIVKFEDLKTKFEAALQNK